MKNIPKCRLDKSDNSDESAKKKNNLVKVANLLQFYHLYWEAV